MKIFLLALTTIFFSINWGNCQISNVDSLERALKKHTQKDKIRFDILESLIKVYMQSNTSKAKIKIDKSIELAKFLRNNRMEIDSRLYRGTLFLYTGQYDSAKNVYNKCIGMSLSANYYKGHGIALKNSGIISLYTGKYELGIEQTQKALSIFEKLSDSNNIAASVINLGILLTRNQQYEKALSQFGIAIKMLDSIPGKYLMKMSTYVNIGGINYDLKRYSDALYYFKQALEIATTKLSPKAEANCLYNIGNIYMSMKKYEDALENLKKAKELRTELNDTRGIGAASIAIGNTYHYLKNYPLAKSYILDGLETVKKLNSAYDIHHGYSILAKNYFKQNTFNKARENVLSAIKIGEKVGPPSTMKNNFELLAKLDSINQDYQSEIKNYKKYVALKDTLLNEEKNRVYAELLAKFESNEKIKTIYEQELKLMKKENEIRVSESRYKNTMVVFYIIMTILILLGGAYFIRDLKKSKALLNSKIQSLKNQLSPHFLFNSLNVLSSLMDKDREDANYFIGKLSALYRYMLDNTDKELVTVKQELDFAKSFFEVMKIRFDSNINLSVELSEVTVNNYYIPPITLQVLLENAVKHTRISKQKPLYVLIKKVSKQKLSISNNLYKKGDIESTKLGLKNLNQLYKINFNKSIDIIQNSTNFEVRIPLLKSNESSNYRK